MAENISTLSYLVDPDAIFLDKNGKILVSGYAEYYLAGTSTKYLTYSNFDGTQNPFRIIIPSDGRIRVLASNLYVYDEYVYDKYGNLVYSRNNISLDRGAINITGYMTTISNTDGNLDILATQSGDNLNYNINIDSEYTDSIYSGINSNSSNIGFVSADLLDEINRAKISEIASRTILEEGSNVDILSSTNSSGQYVYTINSQAGTDIISSNGSIGITSASISDIKVYDLSIAESEIAKNYIKAETTKGTISASTSGVTMSFTVKDFGDLSISNGMILNTNNLSNVHAELDFEFPNYATDVSFHEVGIAIYNGTTLVELVRKTLDGSVQHHNIHLDGLINGSGTVLMNVYSDSSISLSNATATIYINDETSRNITNGSSISDHQVQVDSTSNAGYLSEVLSASYPLNSYISNDKMIIGLSGGTLDTCKVMSYSGDTNPNYLFDKVESTDESISISNDTTNQKVNFKTTYPGAGSITMAESLSLPSCTTFNQFSNIIGGSTYSEIFNLLQPVGNLQIDSGSFIRAMRQYNAWDYARCTLYKWDNTNSKLKLCGYSDLYTSYAKNGLLSIPLIVIKDSAGDVTDSLILTGGDFYYVGLLVKSYTTCPLLGSTLTAPYYIMPKLQFSLNVEASIIDSNGIPLDVVDYSTTTEQDNTQVAWVQIIA